MVAPFRWPAGACEGNSNGEDQGGEPRRRTRRRRDDRIIWSFIKNKLILPYLGVDLKYYDFGMESHDALTSVRQDRP